MSTTLDEAWRSFLSDDRPYEALIAAILPLVPNGRGAHGQGVYLARRIADLIDAKIARSRATVGEDAYMQAVAAGCYALDDEPTPPAKDTGEAEPRGCPTPGACSAAAIIADLEARLAEATNELHCCDDVPLDKGLAEGIASLRRERDEALSSLETAERRIGELEAFAKSFRVSVNESSFYKDVILHLVEPHALSIRLAASKSDKAWIFADLEARRLAALTPDAGTARSEDGEGK